MSQTPSTEPTPQADSKPMPATAAVTTAGPAPTAQVASEAKTSPAAATATPTAPRPAPPSEALTEPLPAAAAVAPAPQPTSVPVEPAWRDPSHELIELARSYGILTEWTDQAGANRRVGAATIEAVLTALGVDVTTPSAVWNSLLARRNEAWRRMLPPVFVSKAGQENTCWIHIPHGDSARAWVDVEGGVRGWALDSIEKWVNPRHIDGQLIGEATVRIPWDMPMGWHVLWAESVGADGVVRKASCPLVITPAKLDPPKTADGRQWGFMSQVYSMRSESSWGIGDLGDLADLAAWSGHVEGADFVLVNPLNATSPVAPLEASPYLPATRRFFNPIYLRVEAIEEFAGLGLAERAMIEELSIPLRALSSSPDLIDRDRIWEGKSKALRIVFQAPLTPGRQARFDAFVAREGQGLIDFAVWCALVEEYGPDFRAWPEALQDARSAEVSAECRRLAESVRWHFWLQWQLDEQLAKAQRNATESGMRSGIVHDLAVGVHPLGSDAWALRDVLAKAVTVGAPPDMYNQLGQDWSQPPWRPDALAEAAFLPYREMLRTILRNAGGIRVDHVLGMFRLWWIPQGFPPSAGAYVQCDHDALVGIMLLEAQRAGAWLVGEDLGTMLPWVQDYLLERGVLGTTVLWFERDRSEEADVPLDPAMWRRNALATVTVHDLPPTAGFLAGEHVRIRSELGLLTRSAAAEMADNEAAIAEWRELVIEHGLLDAEATSDEDFIVALHRLVAESPALLVGVALTDAVGDRRAQNQPGTSTQYPNWKVPLTDAKGAAVTIEQLPNLPLLHRLVEAVKGR